MKTTFFRFALFLFIVSDIPYSAQKKVESFYSRELSRKMEILLIIPEDTIEQITWLLHGYGGSSRTWNALPDLDVWAEMYNMAFVCPSALPDGWYIDSPQRKNSKVKTYLIVELPKWLAHNNLLLPGEKQWAIGTSMGGHGVLTLSLSSPELWAGVSSIAGITELEAFPKKWELRSHLGNFKTSPELWKQHSYNNLLTSGAAPEVYIVLDCGKSDFAYTVNQKTHNILAGMGITHQFWSETGKHNFQYVSKVMKKHIDFSVKYLKKNQTK